MAAQTQKGESRFQNAGVRYQKRIDSLGVGRENPSQKITSAPGQLTAEDEARLAQLEMLEQQTRYTEMQSQNVSQKVVKVKTARKFSRFGVWMGVSVAFTCYIIQFWLGLFSLFLFSGAAVASGTITGAILDHILSFVGGFTMMGAAEALWGITSVFVLITFFGFLLWFRLVGINPFKTVMSVLITFLALAVSLIPVGNLFPCLVLWVAWLNLTNLFSHAS